MPEVTMIPASIARTSAKASTGVQCRRVAAYARVSTDSEEQLTSYEAQVDHYTKYIQSREDWVFVGIYTDEGISATNTRKRDGFNKMVSDAVAGKIDLIVTKSVSRFARNTVDSLTTVRKLKDKNVEVYFEKENIYTFDGKGELLITIMSSLAQEESRSISENVTWGVRKRMADGRVYLPYKHFLGYRKGEDGLPEVVEEEAAIVRRIFRQFMEGKTPSMIAKLLQVDGILSPGGSQVWQVATVRSILTNEKYKGDALLQKRYTVDFLTKERKLNHGEVPQYYVQNSHPAIIDPDDFDAAQAEIARRKEISRPNTCGSVFSSKIICGDCGGYYGPKVWNSNRPNRKIIWRCNDKYKHDPHCQTPHITEEEIRVQFVEAFNRLLGMKEQVIADCRIARETLHDCSSLEREIADLRKEQEQVAELARIAILEHVSVAEGGVNTLQMKYLAKHDALAQQIVQLEAECRRRVEKCDLIAKFIHCLAKQENFIDTFDEKLFMAVVDHVTVFMGRKANYTFGSITEAF